MEILKNLPYFRCHSIMPSLLLKFGCKDGFPNAIVISAMRQFDDHVPKMEDYSQQVQIW
jgi:hypothetical protein